MEEAGHDDHHDMVCYDMNIHAVDSTITTEEDCDAAGLMWTAADSGPSDDDHGDDDHDGDGGMQTMSGHGDHSEDDDDDHGDEDHHDVGAVIIHIEEEGDYGFAMPSDIEFYVIMGEGGHDDHDDHGDEHDDHSDEEGDHDDHSDEEGDHGDEDHSDGIEADEGEEEFDYDPHSWLDPLSFNEQLKLVQDKLTMTFPEGTEVFAENTEVYSEQLTQLHDRFEVALGDQGTCVTGGSAKTIVANHNAYSYMSVRYDIDVVSVHGLDPEGEPSPAEIAEVVEKIKEEGITVLFVEEFTDPSAVQSIVEETGVEVQILYTMEMRPSDNTDDYLSMMDKNIVNIVTGIGC
jgi:zinc transport system substrate-binding protein